VGTRHRLAALLPAVAVLLIAGCGGRANGGPPSPTPTPTPLSTIDLQYKLLAQFGPLQYCDPDSYPVGRPVTPAYVHTRLSQIAAQDPQTYQAILGHYQLTPPLTQQQEAQVYGDYKQLAAIQLTVNGGKYDFAFPARSQTSGQGTLIKGTIDKTGAIVVQSRTGYARPCPICLSASTMIETPTGPVVVTALRPGMPVWTADRSGNRQAAVVVEVGNTVAPLGHRVVHLVLADGRELWVSPGHPTADGRHVGDLAVGDRFDGSQVVTAELAAYAGRTYDLLPSGPTGFYWANGVLLGSTLRP
jgi:hypothetical protein